MISTEQKIAIAIRIAIKTVPEKSQIDFHLRIDPRI